MSWSAHFDWMWGNIPLSPIGLRMLNRHKGHGDQTTVQTDTCCLLVGKINHIMVAIICRHGEVCVDGWIKIRDKHPPPSPSHAITIISDTLVHVTYIAYLIKAPSSLGAPNVAYSNITLEPVCPNSYGSFSYAWSFCKEKAVHGLRSTIYCFYNLSFFACLRSASKDILRTFWLCLWLHVNRLLFFAWKLTFLQT